MPPEVTCNICATAAGPTCVACTARVRHHLLGILKYQQRAELAPGQGGDGRSTERTIGVRVNALDSATAHTYVNLLELWEIDWRQYFNLTPYGLASASRNRSTLPHLILGGIVEFLVLYLHKAAEEHPAFPEFAGEVRTLYVQAKDAANERKRPQWRVTCPTDTSDGECGREFMISGEDFGGDVYCKVCGTTWPVERLLRVVASSRLSELWLDPDAAAEYCGVSSRLLRKWGQQGLIRRERGRYEVHSIREALSEA
jgi:hypothetical protein